MGRALPNFPKKVSPDECGMEEHKRLKPVEITNFLSIAWFPKKNYHDVLYKYPFRLNAASFFRISDIWNMCSFWGSKSKFHIYLVLSTEHLLRALAILILLRCGNVRLAPLFRSWKDVELEDLFDWH